MNPLVVDLSHWDPADDYAKIKASGIVGVIYKATDNTTYNDPTYKEQKALAKAAGLRWGSYHFAFPSNVQAQVQNYLKFANPEPDEIFCLDWENAKTGTMSAAEAKAWILATETALGRPGQCLIYSGNVAKELIQGKDPFFGSRRLWLAQYSSTPVTQASWDTYWLWQYTDGQVGQAPHTVPGVGPCDINSYSGSPEQLAAEWASGKATAVVPSVEVPTVTITIDAPPGVRVVVVNK